MTRLPKLLAAGVFLLSVFLASPARPEALLELKVKDQAYQGKLVAHDSDVCWLMDRDGRLHRLDVGKIGEHRSVSGEFRRMSDGDVRDHLRREFGKEYGIAGTSHYLVCAAKGRANDFAPIFEEIYRSFHRYISARGVKVQQPEFALVAIVFPDHRSFADYARKDGVTASQGLMGYYLPTSNRVALFDDGSSRQQASTGNDLTIPLAHADMFDVFARRQPNAFGFPTAFADVTWHGSIRASLQDTIVHETTHQVAFNSGLHSRIADNPRWVVEGIATVFESPGVRDSQGTTPAMRINRERYLWFGNFAKTRRKPKSLAAFVANDASLFNASPLDAYSQAWALTFFLIETRSAEYSRYMKTLAGRDPMKSYPPDERLADFKQAFGNDLNSLDTQLERFIDRLN